MGCSLGLPEGSLGLPALQGLLQAVDGCLHRHGGRRLEDPADAGHGLPARLRPALPDAGRLAPDAGLAAEVAHVPRALLDLVPLRDLAERRAVARTPLARDAGLLGVLCHSAGQRRWVCRDGGWLSEASA